MERHRYPIVIPNVTCHSRALIYPYKILGAAKNSLLLTHSELLVFLETRHDEIGSATNAVKSVKEQWENPHLSRAEIATIKDCYKQVCFSAVAFGASVHFCASGHHSWMLRHLGQSKAVLPTSAAAIEGYACGWVHC